MSMPRCRAAVSASSRNFAGDTPVTERMSNDLVHGLSAAECRRIGHVAFVERDVIFGQIAGIHHELAAARGEDRHGDRIRAQT